jgi:hypothetical protein
MTTLLFRGLNLGIPDIQAGNGLGFAIESFPKTGAIGETPRQNLDGYGPVKARIARFVDLAHAARTDGGENFVGP